MIEIRNPEKWYLLVIYLYNLVTLGCKMALFENGAEITYFHYRHWKNLQKSAL